MTDVLGADLSDYPAMREVCEAIATYDKVAIRSSHGIGKTFTVGRIALWWNQTRPDSIVVSTAPGWEQVETLLWAEINDAWGKAQRPLVGECLQTMIKVAPKWYATGFSTDRPVRFQGKHAAGGVLFIGDEASGIPEEILQKASTFGTQGDFKEVLIGNPYSRSGAFADVFEHRPPDHKGLHVGPNGWATFELSAFDAPERICSRSWVEEKQREFGPNFLTHPLYRIQVLGQPADADEHGLFPWSIIEKSEGFQPTHLVGREMGVDLARFGKDKCVALLLVNGRVAALHWWEKVDLMESWQIVKALAKKWEVMAERIHVDVVGIGAGVVDRAKEDDWILDPVDFGSGPKGDWKHLAGREMAFENRRAELFWAAHRLMHEGELAVGSNYPKVRNDLVAIPYSYDGKGRLRIVSKEKIKKTLGRSPDFADALVLALSKPAGTTIRVRSLGGKRGGRKIETRSKARTRSTT